MIDFRAWLRYESDFPHWLGTIAKEIRESGWTGASPQSLREWMIENKYPEDRIKEIDAVERFFLLYRQRIAAGRSL